MHPDPSSEDATDSDLRSSSSRAQPSVSTHGSQDLLLKTLFHFLKSGHYYTHVWQRGQEDLGVEEGFHELHTAGEVEQSSNQTEFPPS